MFMFSGIHLRAFQHEELMGLIHDMCLDIVFWNYNHTYQEKMH